MPSLKQLSRIFYIYTEAACAVFMACAALVELLCGIAIGGPLSTLAYSASGLFALVAVSCVLYIYVQEHP